MPTNDPAVLSVSALNERLRGVLEGAFPFVWVRGEVTNLGRPGSGHVYFSLRDGDDLLNCVWFKARQRTAETFDLLTGEVYEGGPRESLARTMRDGDTIICAGRITVFGPRGQYQLLVEMAQDAGQGELLRRLEVLKCRLAERGWFSQERKRPLPELPSRIAVITAPTGAAIRDFLRIAKTRGIGAKIRIFPVPVQGDNAAPAIIRALSRVNSCGWAEVAVIIRGGGSLEDLWPFNDEKLAEAVVHSRVPVLSGIGHEVDTSICDLAADCRAATPSHAAQLLWRERSWYIQRLDELTLSLMRAAKQRFCGYEFHSDTLIRTLTLLSPARRLLWREERLQAFSQRLGCAGRDIPRRLEEKFCALCLRFASVGNSVPKRLENQLSEYTLRLNALNPEAPLARGYAMVFDEQGGLVRGVAQLAPSQTLSLHLCDGRADAEVFKIYPKSSDSK